MLTWPSTRQPRNCISAQANNLFGRILGSVVCQLCKCRDQMAKGSRHEKASCEVHQTLNFWGLSRANWPQAFDTIQHGHNTINTTMFVGHCQPVIMQSLDTKRDPQHIEGTLKTLGLVVIGGPCKIPAQNIQHWMNRWVKYLRAFRAFYRWKVIKIMADDSFQCHWEYMPQSLRYTNESINRPCCTKR